MISQQPLFFVILLILTVSCKTIQTSSIEEVTIDGLQKSYSGSVSFSITNASINPIQIESTRHFFIQKKSGSSWERTPYIPCPCGTPCRPSEPSMLDTGESIDINWSLITRRCEDNSNSPIPKTIEKKAEPGKYRMTFVVNISESGMRLNPKSLVVEFMVK